MPLKILTISDLHLGRRSSEVPVTEKESSTRYTWEKIVEWCISHDIDALLLAGDIVDRENRYFEAVGPFSAGLRKLSNSGVTVVMVAGNHDFDVLPSMVRGNKYKNVHLLGEKGIWEVRQLELGGRIIQFAGWSFPAQYVHESPLLTFAAEELNPNLTTIGIFHGDAFSRDSKYGPFDINTIPPSPVNVWVVGHIHKPLTLKEFYPGIFYPGSPHALSPRETGAHGGLLLTILEKHDVRYEPVHFSPVRYESLSINITGAKDRSELQGKVTSSLSVQAGKIIGGSEPFRYLVADIILEGHHHDLTELKAWTATATDYHPETGTSTEVIIRKVITDAEPEIDNLPELALQPTPAGILSATILAIQKGEATDFLRTLRKQWHSEHEKLITSPAYQPLYLSENMAVQDSDADVYIIRECKRLLGELVKQQANQM